MNLSLRNHTRRTFRTLASLACAASLLGGSLPVRAQEEVLLPAEEQPFTQVDEMPVVTDEESLALQPVFPTEPPPSAPIPTTPAPQSLSYTPRPAGQFIYGALLANLAMAPRARSAGFTHIWGYVPWKNVEPEPGHFVWKTKDQWGGTTPNDLTNVLTAARDNNLKFVLRLNDVPGWAGGAVYKVNPADIERYVYEAVLYGKSMSNGGGNVIDIVEVFNELNLPIEWGTSPTDPAASVKILQAAYRGAKRADPNVRVAAAAVSPRTGGLGGTMEDVDWLDGFYRAGGKDAFDLMGMHPYVGSYAPEQDPSCTPMCFRTLELWRAVMEKYGDTKPAFITEVGTLEKAPIDLGPYQWMTLSAEKRAEYLVQSLRLANGNYPWVTGAMVFNLDYATTPWNPPTAERYWFSLLNQDGSPRPAYTAFQQARRDGTLP